MFDVRVAVVPLGLCVIPVFLRARSGWFLCVLLLIKGRVEALRWR